MWFTKCFDTIKDITMIHTLLHTLTGIFLIAAAAVFIVAFLAAIWNAVSWVVQYAMSLLSDEKRAKIDNIVHYLSIGLFVLSLIGLFVVYGLLVHHIFWCHHHLGLRL